MINRTKVHFQEGDAINYCQISYLKLFTFGRGGYLKGHPNMSYPDVMNLCCAS